ncbi:MAG: group 1 glycosyl transferase [Bacteroidetes bacterium]|nr:MAG: group 1 glycosyl transferase [Bacteroidota bacterium]
MPKRVLIITYYWPPSGGAGVQRWLKFVKYLRDYGWEPVVYTPSNPEYPVLDESLVHDVPEGIEIVRTPIREPYGAYKKITGRKKDDRLGAGMLSEKKRKGWKENLSMWVRGNFFIPDARKWWISPSIKYLENYIREKPVDAIVSTGPPHSMHLVALGLKQENPGLRWIADFRDPWTNIDFYHELKLTSWADRKHHRLERAVLDHADKIVSVGKTMSDEFRALASENKRDPERFIVIANGYDEDDVYKGALERDAKFSIAHVGTLGQARNPALLWNVLQELTGADPVFAADLEIKLVGKVDGAVLESIRGAGLEKYLNKIDYLPHREVTKFQQQCRVLLLLVNNTPNAKGILTGKVFEYMASGTPVLAIGPEDGDLAEVMQETGCGLIAGFENKNSLREKLLQLYADYKSARTNSVSGKVALYSRKALSEKMAAALNG